MFCRNGSSADKKTAFVSLFLSLTCVSNVPCCIDRDNKVKSACKYGSAGEGRNDVYAVAQIEE